VELLLVGDHLHRLQVGLHPPHHLRLNVQHQESEPRRKWKIARKKIEEKRDTEKRQRGKSKKMSRQIKFLLF
jgi:hypothetical protein